MCILWYVQHVACGYRTFLFLFYTMRCPGHGFTWCAVHCTDAQIVIAMQMGYNIYVLYIYTQTYFQNYELGKYVFLGKRLNHHFASKF